VEALQRALDQLAHNPGIGSPALGHELGIAGLRTWLIDGFPLTSWYVERESHVEVVRLVGQRQDALLIDPELP
jgi:toxin ParE1/3/4